MRKGWFKISLEGNRRRLGKCYWAWADLKIARAVLRGELSRLSDLSEIAHWVNSNQ